MKRFLQILLFINITVNGSGQNVDSLYHLYKEAGGNRRIAIVNEIAQTVFTLECTDSLFRIEQPAKQVLVDAIANELMSSYASYVLNDLTKAVRFALDAAKLYEQTNDIRAMDLNYSNAAVFYFQMGDYENSIDLMLKCYELEKQLNDPEALGATLNNLGTAYSNWGNHKMAIEYFRQAVEIELPLNRPMYYARRLSSLAKETSLLGDHSEALRLIKEALVHAERIERNERIERVAVHKRVMGNIYIEMDSLEQAEECFKHAVSVFEQNKRQQMLAESLFDLGRLQIRQHRRMEAIETLKRCIDLCEINNLLRVQRDASHFLYEAYKQIDPETQSLFYLEQYRTLNDSIFKETTQKQIAEFQIKFETAEKELAIERQQSEISRHRTRQNMFIGGLSVAALLLVLLVYVVKLRTRRNRELTETNATKDKFFSIISHDLKNPAIALRDALQLLSENSVSWDTTVLSDYYKKLLKSADGQVDLLYTLLGWAQLQTGRMPYNPVSFDFVAAIQSSVGIIKNMAEDKGLTFIVQSSDIALVTGDYNMLTTVVRNLLTNAVKFTPRGGTVTLDIIPACFASPISSASPNSSISPNSSVSPSSSVSPITPASPITPSSPISACTVSITDTGIGLTNEQLQNLYRLERQQSRHGTSGEQGSGLGLIVCRELLEKHGSQLHVESEEGRGSRFWFEV